MAKNLEIKLEFNLTCQKGFPSTTIVKETKRILSMTHITKKHDLQALYD